jgi:hypothetical protein
MKEIELIFTQLREKLATAETAQRRDIALDTAQLQVQQVLIRLGADKGLVGIKRAKA